MSYLQHGGRMEGTEDIEIDEMVTKGPASRTRASYRIRGIFHSTPTMPPVHIDLTKEVPAATKPPRRGGVSISGTGRGGLCISGVGRGDIVATINATAIGIGAAATSTGAKLKGKCIVTTIE
ncbi:hypothetical protein FH972_019934 [Carpinus fangiana]|uniref:Uncharacterized protein n=1 Tax=Carpinus fangiana TaxID=176857 RepID=A0A5N6RTV6_9ROSI|nr:hypothetical protein FH972_019934 [Carpinus fangiana]